LELNLLPPLLTALETEEDPEVVAKCVTCLSGLTKNNTAALDKVRSVLGHGLLPLMRILSNQIMEKAHKRLLFYLNSLVESAVGQDVFDDAVTGKWGDHVLGLLKFESVDVDTVEKVTDYFPYSKCFIYWYVRHSHF
jgi:hypothetical protein